jgi:hypothetical protein
MDNIAAKLGMDPTEFRLKNTPKAGDKIVGVPKLRDVSLGETIKIAKEKIGWGKVKLEKNQGIGLATGSWIESAGPGGGSIVKVNEDGSVTGPHRQDRHGHDPRIRYSNDRRRGARYPSERCHCAQCRYRRQPMGRRHGRQPGHSGVRRRIPARCHRRAQSAF